MVEEYTIEGTWEEIAARGEEFAGRSVRLTIVPDPVSVAPDRQSRKSIETKIMERSSRVPKEEWDNLPSDLLDRLDDYLYGKPAG